MESTQIEFLWKAMAILPRNHEACNILQCHLMSVCRSMDGVGDAQLPKKYTQKSSMCQHCSNVWKNGNCSTKVLPEKAQPKSIRKIISRYNKDPSCLRKFEVGLARKYARRKNTLVITCHICHKETKLNVFKPEEKIQLGNKSLMEEPLSETKRKKKRYSRDRTAGLIIPPGNQKNAQKKIIEIHKKADACYNATESGNESSSFSCINEEKVDNKISVIAKEFVNSKANKKKKKTLEDPSEFLSMKKHYTPKMMKSHNDTPKRNALIKLVKNNKMGNLFSGANQSSESPLSKFLSSL